MNTLWPGSAPRAGRAALIIVLLLLLSGCDVTVFNEKNIPEGPDRFVRAFIELLRKGDMDTASTQLAPHLRNPESIEGLKKMASDISGGELKSIRVVRYSHYKDMFKDETRSKLAYELGIDGRWAFVEAVLDGRDGVYKFIAFYIEPRKLSRKERNVFTLSEKTISQYAVLAMALAVPAFILWVAYRCVVSGVRRRWLWVVFILFGFGGYYVNWTSGIWWFKLFSFSVLGGAASRNGLDGPWIISFYIPVGALVFYFRNIRKRKKELFGPPVDQPPTLPSTDNTP